ncbi:hypothetical protein Droror1_Dr00014829 [Drosera rotundifolia]
MENLPIGFWRVFEVERLPSWVLYLKRFLMIYRTPFSPFRSIDHVVVYGMSASYSCIIAVSAYLVWSCLSFHCNAKSFFRFVGKHQNAFAYPFFGLCHQKAKNALVKKIQNSISSFWTFLRRNQNTENAIHPVARFEGQTRLLRQMIHSSASNPLPGAFLFPGVVVFFGFQQVRRAVK